MRERPRRHPWRAGYVIVPVALIVGLLQILIPSDGNHVGWPGKRSADATAPVATATPAAPPERRQAQSLSESDGRSADPQSALPKAGTSVSSTAPAEKAGPAAPSQARVFIHHTAGPDNALPAIQLAAYLETHGFTVTDIRQVDILIERPSVRYFFEDDQPESRRLVEAIGAFFAEAPGRGPNEAADFSHFLQKPRRGNIEVWLPAAGGDTSHST